MATSEPARMSDGLKTFKHEALGIEITLVNVVCTFNTQTKLDLKAIANRTRNAEYNPSRFPACMMRLRDPRCTAMLFSSGKVTVTGTKTERDALLAGNKIVKILKKLKFDVQKESVKDLDWKVSNLVGGATLNFPIRLEGLALGHLSNCSYEPELFPGLIYRLLEPRLVVLCFVTGKLVITGAKTKQDMVTALGIIHDKARAYRK